MRSRSFRTRLAASLCAAALMSAVAMAEAVSQGVTPGACSLPPVTLPLFDATPAATVAATPIPASDPASVEEQEIRDAIDVIVACVNTGDPAFRYAVFTERYLAEQLADPSQIYQPQFEQQLAAGPLESGPALELVRIDDLEVRDDGRVAVTIELAGPAGAYRDRLVLAMVDGAWLIDNVELLDPAAS